MSTKLPELPELSPITEDTIKSKTKKSPEALRKLLLPTSTFVLCDDDNNSTFSELSDKYPDVRKDDCVLRTYRSDKGESVLDEFTEDYRKTIMELREELQISNSISDYFENIKSKKAKTITDVSTTKSKINETIDLTDVAKEADSESADDTIVPAQIWNLMSLNSKDAPFQVTPPNYNCYKQEKPHWLETPQIPWKILNTSLVKCQNWLDEQFEQQ